MEDFDLGVAKLKSDPGLAQHVLEARPRLLMPHPSADPAERLEEISTLLSKSIVDQLNKDHFKAQRISRDAPRPTTGWMISGEVLSADEGNRMERAIIGFGAGESQAELYVAATDLTQHSGQAFVTMNVESQSGHGPGAVVTLSPFAAAAKFALGKNASNDDIKRAGEEIAKSIEKYADDPDPAPAPAK